MTEGLTSVAKAVRDRTGRVVASIAVTHTYDNQAPALPPAAQGSPEDTILATLDRAALELSRRLGWNPEHQG